MSKEVKTIQMEFFGNVRQFVVDSRKNKKSEVVEHLIPLLAEGESAIDLLVAAVGGNAEKIRTAVIRDIIRPAAVEATAAAVTPEGLDPTKYAAAFAAYFEPASRRAGGPTLAELKERIAELSPRFMELIKLYQSHGPGFENTPEGLEFARLYAESEDLNAKIAEKEKGAATRKPRKKKDKSAAAAAAAGEPAAAPAASTPAISG